MRPDYSALTQETLDDLNGLERQLRNGTRALTDREWILTLMDYMNPEDVLKAYDAKERLHSESFQNPGSTNL